MSDKKTFICNWPVKHGGKVRTGDIELTQAEAKDLLALGAIRQPDSALDDEHDGVESKAPLTDEQKMPFIVEAIAKLDKDNADHWTKDGKPVTQAIEAELDFQVSAALRNAAWETLAKDES